MRTTKIECDTCLRELNDSSPAQSFRLHLSCERIPNRTGFSYAMPDNPPMTMDADFCSMACLAEWAEKHPFYFKKKSVA